MVQIKLKGVKCRVRRVVYRKNGLDFTLYRLKVDKTWKENLFVKRRERDVKY